MENGPSNPLPESKAYALLANRRRRIAVTVLDDSPTRLSVALLADRIANRETDDPSEERHRRIRITLHHVHLPQLLEADVITYDRSVGTVGKGPNFDVLVDLLGEEDDCFVGSS